MIQPEKANMTEAYTISRHITTFHRSIHLVIAYYRDAKSTTADSWLIIYL